MELCDNLTQLSHNCSTSPLTSTSSAFWVPGVGHTASCLSSTQKPVSLSLTPSDSNCPSSVTTRFFTLIGKHFQDEAKLASVHLSRFWSWSHLVSPVGSQPMANWAQVLGEAMGLRIRMLDGDGGMGRSKAFPHSDSPTPTPRITTICATIVDYIVTLSPVCPGTELVPHPSFPWLAFRYSETTIMLHLFISYFLDQKAHVCSHFHGVLELEPFIGGSFRA